MITEQEFERLYAKHAQRLFGFLMYRTGDRTAAEDLLAETFERAYRGRGRYDRRRASRTTWLYAIALNCLRDQARRKAAEERALERREATTPRAEPNPQPETIESRSDLTLALEALTDEEREAIALRYGADLTVPEIAKLTT